MITLSLCMINSIIIDKGIKYVTGIDEITNIDSEFSILIIKVRD